MELREIKMESRKILSPAPQRDVRIYSNILNVGYIFIEGVEVDGWVILMFFLGGGGSKMRKRRDCYISSLQILNLHICFHLCIYNI